MYVFEQSVRIQIYDTQDIYPVLSGFYGNNTIISGKPATANGLTHLPDYAGIDIIQNDLIISTENHFVDHSEILTVSPNPAAEVISLELRTDNPFGVFTREIMQMNGPGVKSGKLTAGQRQISLSGLPSGVYILTIKRSGRIISNEKIIKQ